MKSKVTANPKGRFVYLARQVNPTIGDCEKLNLPGFISGRNQNGITRPAL
ncbi:hypothetical protein NWE50_03905 [Morganella morganii]|nr:hypothetical protein [Morganella morganii]